MASKYERFIYFMERTTSEHDNEALTALRMANKMLAESNMSWEELLKAKKAISDERSYEPLPGEPASNAGSDPIQHMFDVLLKDVKGPFRSFIESVYRQYKTRGSLSPKQEQAVRDAYARTTHTAA